MKVRNLIFGTMLLLCSTRAGAVPAYPGLIHATQADGTPITIQRLGDEYGSITLTADGFPLWYNTATANYEYATLASGTLQTTGIVATDVAVRQQAVKSVLSGIDRQAVSSWFASKLQAAHQTAAKSRMRHAMRPNKTVRMNDVPTLGQHEALIILVQFSDVKFKMDDPAAYYDRFFHKEGFSDNGACGSAHDFYYQSSAGKYDPQFRVFGPVTVSMNHTAYAGTMQGTANTWKMIREAVAQADSLYDINFKDFDTDGDGKVDNVYCIYAGYGQADSKDNSSIWPHSGYLSEAYQGSGGYANETIEKDGVTIDRYTVSQEINGQTDLTCGIGTFVHEFGHVLGLADHYNNGNATATNQLGYWDLMASGSYNGEQNCPATFSAFERYSLGWLNLTTLSPTTDSIITVSPLIDSNSAYRVSVPGSSNEYFIVENRQQKSWDECLPGHGLLVWHIDEDQDTWNKNMPNYDATHQHVDIVEADGHSSRQGKASDAFPGTSGITSFEFSDWSSTRRFGFAWLDETVGANCRVLLSGTDFHLPAPTEISVSDVKGTSATISWNAARLADGYVALVLKGDSVVATATTDSTSRTFTATGLQPLTDYTAVVVPTLSTILADSARQAFTTTDLQIEERPVELLSAQNVSASGFTARWKEYNGADRYEVTLLSAVHDKVVETGTGFDNYTRDNPNLPEGWSTNNTSSAYSVPVSDSQTPPAFRMNKDSVWLKAAAQGQKVNRVRFLYYANKAGATLRVSEYADGAWKVVKSYTPDGRIVAIDTLSLNDADSVMFQIDRPSGNAYFLLDDVYVGYVSDRFTAIKTINVSASEATSDEPGVCSLAFADLQNGQQYAYTVRAYAGERASLSADTMLVEAVPTAITTVRAKGRCVPVYNLLGHRVGMASDGRHPDARLPRGIYIVGETKVAVR